MHAESEAKAGPLWPFGHHAGDQDAAVGEPEDSVEGGPPKKPSVSPMHQGRRRRCPGEIPTSRAVATTSDSAGAAEWGLA
ncbi:MAG: hypothetical protein EA352_05870 [Gemmatimonadales bacterium]|nr:MAG: hypothetical protein EA352_05870 [Gemmatimonadales bacterium]